MSAAVSLKILIDLVVYGKLVSKRMPKSRALASRSMNLSRESEKLYFSLPIAAIALFPRSAISR